MYVIPPSPKFPWNLAILMARIYFRLPCICWDLQQLEVDLCQECLNLFQLHLSRRVGVTCFSWIPACPCEKNTNVFYCSPEVFSVLIQASEQSLSEVLSKLCSQEKGVVFSDLGAPEKQFYEMAPVGQIAESSMHNKRRKVQAPTDMSLVRRGSRSSRC